MVDNAMKDYLWSINFVSRDREFEKGGGISSQQTSQSSITAGMIII
ncbi:hypothetical protein BMS3Bbin04_01893 [bacterium BMS3Bbin04]|nr:hypothetical protein BMS3Bbin04_01893 [bacterium BMS3Bbin04]